MTEYILCVDCPDQPGIVAAVANCLQKNNCNIEDAAQFNDKLSGRFFMRVEVKALSEEYSDDIEGLRKDFAVLAGHFSMDWSLYDTQDKPRTLIMVSKQDHCLNDLLYRWRTNHLHMDITAIVSNHDTSRAYVEQRGLTFHHMPITPDTKAEQEKALRNLIEETKTELIVLARYMQILSPEFCRDFPGRIINIHHSFLPGFKGAKPYAQAYERGVKIIGATAHFVTEDLDEGPIIEQDVARADHRQDPQKLELTGRDTEAQVLARAVQYFTERRIFLHGHRTVIL